MKRTFEEALANRRSYYHIGHESPVADDEIIRIIHEAVKHVPSAYNSQSTRIVLLLGDEHQKLWKIVKKILKMMLPEEVFARTERKIDTSFSSGYGTVLFFEDTSVRELICFKDIRSSVLYSFYGLNYAFRGREFTLH